MSAYSYVCSNNFKNIFFDNITSFYYIEHMFCSEVKNKKAKEI